MSELLNCPFCGSDAVLDEAPHPETASMMYRGRCGDEYGERECPAHPQGYWDDKHMAVKAWNRRASSMPDDAAIERSLDAQTEAEYKYFKECSTNGGPQFDYGTQKRAGMRAALAAYQKEGGGR